MATWDKCKASKVLDCVSSIIAFTWRGEQLDGSLPAAGWMTNPFCISFARWNSSWGNKIGAETRQYHPYIFKRTMHYSAKFILSSALYQKGFVKSFIGVSIWTFKKYILGSYELEIQLLPQTSISLCGYSQEQQPLRILWLMILLN